MGFLLVCGRRFRLRTSSLKNGPGVDLKFERRDQEKLSEIREKAKKEMVNFLFLELLSESS
jgi:hypothetical protein